MSETATSAPTGYATTTKVLHWATVVVLLAQFIVGYAMDVEDDPAKAAREARAERLDERADRAGSESREEALEERADALEDVDGIEAGAVLDRVLGGDEPLLSIHVGLGLTVVVLALVRLTRRRVVELPPWAETLTETERRFAHRTEQLLYLALVVMPLSGIGVLLVNHDLLPVHIGSHVLFFVALAAHVGLVLKHQLVDRDRLLGRML
jgi:cytochrome b561